MKTIFLFLSGLVLSGGIFAQTIKSPVQVDKPIGNFILNDVRYYTKKSVTNEDFKGKWLILDFWNQSCTVCVHAMPKTDSLQQKLKGKAQVMMVGYTGSQYHPLDRRPDEKSIKKLYSRIRKISNITLPSAFDSTLFHRFDISGCPYVVIVNPDGIVKGISTYVTYNQMDSLERGMQVHFKKAYTFNEYREKLRQARKANVPVSF